MKLKFVVAALLSCFFVLQQASAEVVALQPSTDNITANNKLSFVERERELKKEYVGSNAEPFNEYPKVYSGNLHPIYMCPQWSTLDDTCEGLDFKQRDTNDNEVLREEFFWPNYVDNVDGAYKEPISKKSMGVAERQKAKMGRAVWKGREAKVEKNSPERDPEQREPVKATVDEMASIVPSQSELNSDQAKDIQVVTMLPELESVGAKVNDMNQEEQRDSRELDRILQAIVESMRESVKLLMNFTNFNEQKDETKAMTEPNLAVQQLEQGTSIVAVVELGDEFKESNGTTGIQDNEPNDAALMAMIQDIQSQAFLDATLDAQTGPGEEAATGRTVNNPSSIFCNALIHGRDDEMCSCWEQTMPTEEQPHRQFEVLAIPLVCVSEDLPKEQNNSAAAQVEASHERENITAASCPAQPITENDGVPAAEMLADGEQIFALPQLGTFAVNETSSCDAALPLMNDELTELHRAQEFPSNEAEWSVYVPVSNNMSSLYVEQTSNSIADEYAEGRYCQILTDYSDECGVTEVVSNGNCASAVAYCFTPPFDDTDEYPHLNATTIITSQSYACWSRASEEEPNMWQECCCSNEDANMTQSYFYMEHTTTLYEQEFCKSTMLHSNTTAGWMQTLQLTFANETGIFECKNYAADVNATAEMKPTKAAEQMPEDEFEKAPELMQLSEQPAEHKGAQVEELQMNALLYPPKTADEFIKYLQNTHQISASQELAHLPYEEQQALEHVGTLEAAQEYIPFEEPIAEQEPLSDELGNETDDQLPKFLHQRQELILELFKRIDANQDDYIAHEELKHWLHYVEHMEHYELTDSLWQRLNPANSVSLSWPMYCKQVHGYAAMPLQVPLQLRPDNKHILNDYYRWRAADENCDNELNRYEFDKFLHDELDMQLHELMVNETLQLLDTNQDQLISFDEYLSEIYAERVSDEYADKAREQYFNYYIQRQMEQCPSGEELPAWIAIEQENYIQYDRNGDGMLDRNEFMSSFMSTEHQYLDKRTRVLIDEADADEDKQLSFNEMLDNYVLFIGTASDII